MYTARAMGQMTTRTAKGRSTSQTALRAAAFAAATHLRTRSALIALVGVVYAVVLALNVWVLVTRRGSRSCWMYRVPARRESAG